MSHLRTLKRGVLSAQGKLPKKKKWNNKYNRSSQRFMFERMMVK